MSQVRVTLDDSDCLIEEQNISCITLDDSHDEDSNDGRPPGKEDGGMEEGELEDDDSTTSDKICEIKFTNSQKYEKYGNVIIEVLKNKLNESENEAFIEIVSVGKDDCMTLQVRLANNPPNIVHPTGQTIVIHEESSKNNTEIFEKELSPDLTGISELFTIDTNPAKLDSVEVPSYKRAIKDAMLDEEAAAHKRQKQEERNMKASKASSCFNCGEPGHSIKECSMPYNTRRIKMAKKAFSKVERYHVDVEQRFAHLRPGCISDKMREALNLRKGELPFFFYRMRVLGYPPGWLEDAKVEHSGINLFNSDGTKILHSDEDDGDAESANAHKYNVSKIIDFPGFNQDPGENFYDDYKYHNVPPMSKNQSKEEFVKTLGDSVLKGYKRKKLKDFPKPIADESVNDSFHTEVFDMEIEDADTTTTANIEFVRPPPPSEPPESLNVVPPPPPPPPPVTPPPPHLRNVEQQTPKSPALPGSPLSPSLAELEKKKKQLLEELQSGNNASIIEIEDSLVDDIIALDNSIQDDHENTSPNDAATADAHTSYDTQGSSESSKDSYKSSESQVDKDVIEKSYMGTPVLKFSPYDCLPNGEKFKVGVSDVINFENLPDSTGKYENMKELIKKVRNVILKLHSDE